MVRMDDETLRNAEIVWGYMTMYQTVDSADCLLSLDAGMIGLQRTGQRSVEITNIILR